MVSILGRNLTGQEARSECTRRSLLLLALAVTLLWTEVALPPMPAHAAGIRSPASGRCSSSTEQPLDARLWYEPVGGEELNATLYGYYSGRHFCGVLAARAALTLPAGSEAEWLCLSVHTGGEDACGVGYDARWTCLTLQSLGTGACGDLGPGPASGQLTFVLAGPARLQSCAGVDLHMQGFFSVDVSIPRTCG
jgi:hypothetical protein